MSEPRPIKQVIVYRRDLKMRKGKIAAQVAHASMRVLLKLATFDPGAPETLTIAMPPAMTRWVHGRFTKVVLSVEDEDALLKVYEEALARALPCALITDSGKTEFNGRPTRTTVAVGPAYADEIDAVTGKSGVVPTKLA